MGIDNYDRQILRLLQQDGRISNQDLADRIGLSPSPCLRRVRALEDAGVIKGYRAQVDAKALGYTLMALIYISMDKHTPDRFEHFEKEISQFSEVLECLLITGQDADGNDVFMADLWPTTDEIEAVVGSSINSEMFRSRYADVFAGDQLRQVAALLRVRPAGGHSSPPRRAKKCCPARRTPAYRTALRGPRWTWCRSFPWPPPPPAPRRGPR